ncbi:serine/threonine protein kinase [Blastococcus sp. CT_GayMR19]|uniref:serine/threonine-protein kinase n=1 Tax=Blastococcus sp. CT_GayMR19 TaxID=2559608 RepID=UPI0010744386|nr:serine/threonine-protein kinase [Blastococcus sp. CT_GayMR19]TFV78284.1 serine/threonine protein kinase [Blastococcus sp. CT_GayMR19]
MRPQVRLLGDRYEMQSVLASGGMGRVWRARDTLLQRPVAVKILRSEFTGNREFLGRFRAEAQHTAVLAHPNIAALYDYGELDQDGEHLAYLVMELVEGESLATLLARERRLDVPQTLGILRATAAGLAAAHAAGVVHRDVKPGNVLLGVGGEVKITDFGIAWSASSVPLTKTGQVIGTAQYLSPEQASGGKAGPASDVYALGAVAYECLAGRRVFDGENSVQIAVMQIRDEPDPLPRELPANVRSLVERTLRKDPAERFPDGAALLAAVEDVLRGRPPVPSARTTTAVMPVPFGVAGTAPATAAARAPGRPASGSGARVAVRMLVGALVALALLAVAVLVVRASGQSPADAGTTEETTPATVAVVELAAEEFVGRPVRDVQAELVARGLQVSVAPFETGNAPAGQVLAVEPVGSVAPDTIITVSYAVPPVVVPPPVEQPDNAGNGTDGNDGNTNNGGNDGNNNNGNGRGNDKDKDEDDD